MCGSLLSGPKVAMPPPAEDAKAQREAEEAAQKKKAREELARRQGASALIYKRNVKGVPREDDDDKLGGIPNNALF